MEARTFKQIWQAMCHASWRGVRAASFTAAYGTAVATAGTLSLPTASFAHSTDKNGDLSIPFDTNSARYWRFVSDRVMGGISNGDLRFGEEDGLYFAHMTGDVTTANNGGFIQFRANLSLAGMADRKFTGVRLMVRGNNEPYYVHFRTKDSGRPPDYFGHSFVATQQWRMVELPFSGFEHNRRYRSDKLTAEAIRSMGIVAYGRDHQADISVATIEFYE